jgi:hypothetical protein
MSDIESEWEADDELGGRPYGGKPYGGKPYGGKPYGGKPYGGKPYGGKPYGGKPYGGKPYGGKPYGGKPYGGKPYGGKPYGGKSPGDVLDLDEWSADIGELFCDRSALVQLGATVVPIEDQLWAPGPGLVSGFRPVAPVPPPVGAVQLDPSRNTIDAMLAMPAALFAQVADDPDLAGPAKADLAEALVGVADAAMLFGPTPLVGGISWQVANAGTVPGDLLATLRGILAQVFGVAPPVNFRRPGWILHPRTVIWLSAIRTTNGWNSAAGPGARTLAELGLFRFDSPRQGMLLGQPFLTSRAVAVAPSFPPSPRIFFGADWDQAWIGVAPSFIDVDLPGLPAVPGARVIRASMSIDFGLRNPLAFGWADWP